MTEKGRVRSAGGTGRSWGLEGMGGHAGGEGSHRGRSLAQRAVVSYAGQSACGQSGHTALNVSFPNPATR